MDKYTKLQKIGQGSFGCAYLCVKKLEPQGRKYVIKEVRMDPRDQQTALREARLLAALDHPNIIGCRESFLAAPNVLCIVTEFADGGDLRKQLTDRTSRRAPYSESELLDLFLQCCLALKHLHDRKIIHRDIKPENIFLTSSHVVKLGDFGVATVLSNTLACAQTLTGTPYYTSPEICLGKKYNAKTDVWSLGCVLYELATFSHAFTGRSQRQLFENIISGSYAAISARAYSPRLVALVGEMLQKNPRDRPSVNQLIRRPVLLERIQSFLSQRAVADELNHTVLHGHHVFQRPPAQQQRNQEVSPVKRPTPASPAVRRQPEIIRRAEAVLNKPVAQSPTARVRAIQYEPPKARNKHEGVRAAVGVRRNSLKSSGSRRAVRKLVSPPKKPSHERRVDLVAKKEAVARAKADAAPKRAKAAVVDKSKPAAAKQEPKPQAVDPSPNGNVSDRVSAFNAQWQAQRKQILNRLAAASPLPPPPPAPAPAARDSEPAVPPPPPAPLLATGIVLKRGKKPTSASAVAAARQREAMRRDILEKKKALAQQHRRGSANTPTPSPLDDPVVLVQNLPDYKPIKLMPPPAPPVVNATPTTQADANEETQEQEEDGGTPDSTVAEKANLEFQRMLLQLQSVVGESIDAGEEDEDEEEEDSPVVSVGPLDSTNKDDELRSTTTLPPPPFDAADKASSRSLELSAAVLEDPGFKAALQARLRGGEAVQPELGQTQQETLSWLHQYIAGLL